uniref:Coiled-coil SMC6 And NSE5 INteracting (CANIN) domain-containing protein n=1 Tax=Ciona savignyi TaxID=51511 RepID=H2YV84_CIOSA
MIDISNVEVFKSKKQMLKQNHHAPKSGGHLKKEKRPSVQNTQKSQQSKIPKFTKSNVERNIWSDYLNGCIKPSNMKSNSSILPVNHLSHSPNLATHSARNENREVDTQSEQTQLNIKRKSEHGLPAMKRKKLEETAVISSIISSKSKNNVNTISPNEEKPLQRISNTQRKTSSDSKVKSNSSPPNNLLEIYGTYSKDHASLASHDSSGISDEDESDLPAFLNNTPSQSNLTSMLIAENREADDYHKENGTCYVSELKDDKDIISFSPCTDLDSLNSSQNSSQTLTTSTAMEMFREFQTKTIPLTPRHIRKCETEDFETIGSPVKIEQSVHMKKSKLKFSLNRLVKDKKEGEKLKQTEDELLKYVKSGGISRLIESSDEEQEETESQEVPEEFKILKEMTSSSENCKSLPHTHNPAKIFSRKLLFCYFCPHNLLYTNMASEPPNALSQMKDVGSQLQFLRSGYVRQMPVSQSTRAGLIHWLLRVIACHADHQLVQIAKEVLSNLLLSYEATSLEHFYEVFCNFGIEPNILSCEKRFRETHCKRCKLSKPKVCSLHHHLSIVLKLFSWCLQNTRKYTTDQELSRYVTMFCMMLSIHSKQNELKQALQQAISNTIDALQNWQEMRLSITRDILKHIDDYHTLESIASDIPMNTVRGVQLRRSLAQSALHRCLDQSKVNDIVPSGIDNGDLQPVATLCKKLSAPNVHSHLSSFNKHVSDFRVLHVLWSCVLLVQISIGLDRVPKQQKASLDEISESLSMLNLAMRDGGSLYCSEVKHFIRLTTARIDFQLQEMPKQLSYQGGIFKYLRASRVSEEVVVGEDSVDTDSPDEMIDSPPVQTDVSIENASNFTISKLTC